LSLHALIYTPAVLLSLQSTLSMGTSTSFVALKPKRWGWQRGSA
jgi:hypothetical protein